MSGRMPVKARNSDLERLLAGLPPGRRQKIIAGAASPELEEEFAALDAAALAEAARDRAVYRRRRYENEMRPPAYADASTRNLLKQQDPGGRLSGWLGSPHRNLLVMGPSGHGKSHAAYAITNAAIDAGLWVEAWYVPDLVAALSPPEAHERRDPDRAAQRERRMERVQECDLLLLDDLGREPATPHIHERWRSQLTTILTHREGARLRTIVTANAEERATGTRVLEPYGAPVITRLRGDCIGAWIEGDCLRVEAAWNPF
ncbi:ATP-binding protein [Bailinhaonella thermotolerans]|uniref:AAA+ ATPase domain-containing protein n=1 Tax=Bailinhaonella thermotolerans TaxID=1070861 RepID=A0A3A4ALK8_9ACTN|nr:ATP-binding protein [Bailinhaonella thermotolerans]RJL22041.1 hypothetical protein D5H75_36170 [Bailinhaonella thermotolerans]